MPLAARIPSEQALIIFAGGRQEIITSVNLESDQPGAAVIFPVPGNPEVSTIRGTAVFTYLAEVTRPEVRIVERVSDGRDTAGGAPPGGVSVLGREIIGGYDVARLAADDLSALWDWLDQNGYQAPDGAEPILERYIAEGWRFVAVKLAPDRAANGALDPLRVAFDSQAIVYPMRLSALADHPLDVLLYVLADHRVDIPQMRTLYAGPVAQLDRPPPEDQAPLFRAPYLTKLRNTDLQPATLTEDFVARQAPNDDPYREIETRVVFVEGSTRRFTAGVVIGLVLVLFASSLALGFALRLRRRISAIAGPDPEEED